MKQNMKKLIVSFAVIATLFLITAIYQGVVSSQTKPFTIGQILRAISTPTDNKKALFKKIIGDVQSRKVDFPLTNENETLLRNEGATDELIAAIRANPTSLKKLSSSEIQFIQNGDQFYRNGDYERAISQYNEAIRIDSQNAEVFLKRGIAYHFLGTKAGKRAAEDYNAALNLNSNLLSSYEFKCLMYLKVEKNSGLDNCNKAIKESQNSGLMYYKRGNIFYDMGNYEQSIADYEKSIKITPNFPLAYLNRGSDYQNIKKQYDLAMNDYNQSIRLNPKIALAYTNRGSIYAIQNNFEQAIIEFQKALVIDPDDKDIKRRLDNAIKDKKARDNL